MTSMTSNRKLRKLPLEKQAPDGMNAAVYKRKERVMIARPKETLSPLKPSEQRTDKK